MRSWSLWKSFWFAAFKTVSSCCFASTSFSIFSCQNFSFFSNSWIKKISNVSDRLRLNNFHVRLLDMQNTYQISFSCHCWILLYKNTNVSLFTRSKYYLYISLLEMWTNIIPQAFKLMKIYKPNQCMDTIE